MMPKNETNTNQTIKDFTKNSKFKMSNNLTISLKNI